MIKFRKLLCRWSFWNCSAIGWRQKVSETQFPKLLGGTPNPNILRRKLRFGNKSFWIFLVYPWLNVYSSFMCLKCFFCCFVTYFYFFVCFIFTRHEFNNILTILTPEVHYLIFSRFFLVFQSMLAAMRQCLGLLSIQCKFLYFEWEMTIRPNNKRKLSHLYAWIDKVYFSLRTIGRLRSTRKARCAAW